MCHTVHLPKDILYFPEKKNQLCLLESTQVGSLGLALSFMLASAVVFWCHRGSGHEDQVMACVQSLRNCLLSTLRAFLCLALQGSSGLQLHLWQVWWAIPIIPYFMGSPHYTCQSHFADNDTEEQIGKMIYLRSHSE